MKEKNAFKEKKGNISVKITLSAPHTYMISAKLSKGKKTTICHDPNKGLITGIASAIYSLDKEAKFLITNHCVAVDKIKKTIDKFWYANSAYDLKLEGCDVSSKGIVCPTGYWSRDSKSEKASTINYQNYMEKMVGLQSSTITAAVQEVTLWIRRERSIKFLKTSQFLMLLW